MDLVEDHGVVVDHLHQEPLDNQEQIVIMVLLIMVMLVVLVLDLRHILLVEVAVLTALEVLVYLVLLELVVQVSKCLQTIVQHKLDHLDAPSLVVVEAVDIITKPHNLLVVLAAVVMDLILLALVQQMVLPTLVAVVVADKQIQMEVD